MARHGLLDLCGRDNDMRDVGTGEVTIYLEPTCGDCAGKSDTGRMWCEDAQEPCEACGKDWEKYVNLDEFVRDFQLFCIESEIPTDFLDDFLKEESL